MRNLRSFASLLAAGLLAVAVAACGQKGPLYLPDATPPATHQQAPAPTPTTTPEKPKQDDTGKHDGSR